MCVLNTFGNSSTNMVRTLWGIPTVGSKSRDGLSIENSCVADQLKAKRTRNRRTLQDFIGYASEADRSMIAEAASCNVNGKDISGTVSGRRFSVRLPSKFGSIIPADTVALVMYSFNPLRDFQDSILEMIRGKNSGDPKFLDELASCYLAMNAPEYHRIITRAFATVLLELGIDIFPSTARIESLNTKSKSSHPFCASTRTAKLCRTIIRKHQFCCQV